MIPVREHRHPRRSLPWASPLPATPPVGPGPRRPARTPPAAASVWIETPPRTGGQRLIADGDGRRKAPAQTAAGLRYGPGTASPRSPMALPGGTSVQCGEDGPHDKGHHEDQQINHDPSRGIWLAWLIVSHYRSSSLALRYRSVFGACRAGAEHLVQGRGSMVCSEEWLSSMARRIGHLVVRRTAHVADDLPAEPARSPWLRPDRRALLREREHVDLARNPGPHPSRRTWPIR
jgi:hypothetical protein